MVSSNGLLQILVVIIVGVVCACALPRVPQYHGNTFQDLQYRSDGERPSDPRKPIREDGLGSLLLKNLRFRDLLSNNRHPSSSWQHSRRTSQRYDSPYSREYEDTRDEYVPSVSKRQMSISQIAELLNNKLNARNADDSGVKLQSLRFGK